MPVTSSRSPAGRSVTVTRQQSLPSMTRFSSASPEMSAWLTVLLRALIVKDALPPGM